MFLKWNFSSRRAADIFLRSLSQRLRKFTKRLQALATFLSYVLLSNGATASANSIGLIGGEDSTGSQPPLGALVDPNGVITNLKLFSITSFGDILSVAINSYGAGLLGGGALPSPMPPFVLLLGPGKTLTQPDLSSITTNGTIKSVAINNSGTCLVGGEDFSGSAPPLAILIAPGGAITDLHLSSITTSGFINGVAINDSGAGLLGGSDQTGVGPGAPLAYLLPPNGLPTKLTLSSAPPNGIINSVAINNSGTGLVGGANTPVGPGPSPPIVFLVAPNGDNISLDFSGTTSHGAISSVAINDSGVGLLGGNDTTSTSAPLAFLVAPNGALTNLNLSSNPPHGFINSVAINNSGTGLLGGKDNSSGAPLAYLVATNGSLTNLNLSSITSAGVINSVAIDDSGAGLIGGNDTTGAHPPLALLVAPNGALTKLNLSSLTTQGAILSVAVSALSKIPTSGLHGNNLTFAKYINSNASSKAFYFVPALIDGTLSLALESAAPTRNAFSILTADNNLFSLNFSLARHSQDSRQYRRYTKGAFSHQGGNKGSLSAFLPTDSMSDYLAMAEVKKWEDSSLLEDGSSDRQQEELFSSETVHPLLEQENGEEALIAMAHIKSKTQRPTHKSKTTIGPYALWGEILGAFSSQKAQHQTPGFKPSSGGVILAFEATAVEQVQVGGGAAYVYTHIHEKEKSGHSSINQEYLFVYSLWSNYDLYCDAALWGGLFQIDNVRNIHMTGFDFQSKAHPNGWQLAPHFELGYDYDFWRQVFMLEPFVLFDWANNWQGHYKETGSGPFNFAQKSHYSSFLRSETGLRFYERIDFHSWRLILKEKIGYVNKKPFGAGTVAGFLVGSPGSFTVETGSTTQNLAAVEMEFLFEPANPRYPYGSISYQGEFCPAYLSNQVSLNVSWSF